MPHTLTRSTVYPYADPYSRPETVSLEELAKTWPKQAAAYRHAFSAENRRAVTEDHAASRRY
jgi:hypothetical protein